MKFISITYLVCFSVLFSCKTSKDTSSKNNQTASEKEKETPYEIKQTEKAPNQTIGAPTPGGGTNGARPEPQ
jgi:hypothetical protein